MLHTRIDFFSALKSRNLEVQISVHLRFAGPHFAIATQNCKHDRGLPDADVCRIIQSLIALYASITQFRMVYVEERKRIHGGHKPVVRGFSQ